MEEPVDITPYLDQLDESLRDKVLQLQKGRWVPVLGVCLVLGGWQTGGFGRVLVGVCGEVTEGCRLWAGRGQPCFAACQALTPTF